MNKSNIIFNDNESNYLLTLPITTTQSLKASIQHFFDVEFKVKINTGTRNQMTFSVLDQDNIAINVGKILLEFYIV